MDKLPLRTIVTTKCPPGWHDTPNPHALPHCQARHGKAVCVKHKITEPFIEVHTCTHPTLSPEARNFPE
ncbi:hypothetical protein M513_11446 [Trichuris suis]|uniref:Uncharacterized protein n=1 Tax=Trichuris suis TaxID=68888 RepID=A0A085LRQ9_9BILA|nr:hypothetical protein M513_11446 [Trichuris suis]